MWRSLDPRTVRYGFFHPVFVAIAVVVCSAAATAAAASARGIVVGARDGRRPATVPMDATDDSRPPDDAGSLPQQHAGAATMLVATVVSMWALSAMAVTVRHGRSRMARWAQQQRNDAPPDGTPAAAAAVDVDGLRDPGGGGGIVVWSSPPSPSLPPSLLQAPDGGGGDGGQHHQHQHLRDKANELLHVVESQQQLGGNCTAGTDLNMGEGVVDRYAQVRFGRVGLNGLKTNIYMARVIKKKNRVVK